MRISYIFSICYLCHFACVSFPYLLTCKKWPKMCVVGSSLGLMGECSKAVSEFIKLTGVTMFNATHGKYSPGSMITVELSSFKHGEHIAFQATGGALFQGILGSKNIDGLIAGCNGTLIKSEGKLHGLTESRFQSYSGRPANLLMPSVLSPLKGTNVVIQCNFATTGPGTLRVTPEIVLSV